MNPISITPPPINTADNPAPKIHEPEKVSILKIAHDIINGRRAQDYGDVRTSFNQIADLWSVYLNRHAERPDTKILSNTIELTGEDVANLMILMKVSRAQNGFHLDSYVDIAGYAGCVEKLQED